MDCILCKIANKEIPSEIIYEDDLVYAVNDINPKAPVHILIVAKKHIKSVNELSGGDKELIAKMIIVAKEIAKNTGIVEGYKLLFNVGKRGGQVIEHLHLHLMGGWGKGAC